jgi:ADP-ribose pyrophosphatase YjhB (NUDIX family)
MTYAVAVLLITPEGIPLIRDPKKPAPVYWKLPGGRSESGETAEAAAVREIKEEIGVVLKEDDLFLIREEDRGSHTLAVFRAKLPKLEGTKHTGDEGEEIRVFSPSDIAAMPDFFPNHRACVTPFLAG